MLSKIRKNRFNLKVVSMFLVATFVFLATFSYVGNNSTVYADSIKDLEDQISKLENENKNINSNLSNAKDKIKNEKQKQEMLTNRISNTQQQITLYGQKIQKMEASIVTKKSEIANKEAEIAKNEDLFAKRIRAMYVSGSSTALTTLLSAQNFSQFLTRAEILKRISQSDQDLIDKLSKQKEELNTAKTNMEMQNKDLNTTKVSLSNKSSELDGLKKQSEQNEYELEKVVNKYYADKKKNQKLIDANEAEIKRIIAERQGDNSQGPEGEYKWPVPASSRITSPFGWRYLFGNKEFHKGIDIGAPAGTSIVAANSGKVIMVKKQSYGYGWYVVVDHGGGQATLYAHTSRIDVKEGDIVARGQTIAGVGTTGNSTGNHLHFEVRINGVQQDPMGYVRK